jgi:hypothetical protein
MAAEVLARRDHADQASPWVDRYIGRLDELPAPVEPVTDDNWRDALGDRVGDWAVYLTRQMAERPWRDVLATWWPRLLPGIAAGATHGVIRTGHAARTVLAGDESPAASRWLRCALRTGRTRPATCRPSSSPRRRCATSATATPARSCWSTPRPRRMRSCTHTARAPRGVLGPQPHRGVGGQRGPDRDLRADGRTAARPATCRADRGRPRLLHPGPGLRSRRRARHQVQRHRRRGIRPVRQSRHARGCDSGRPSHRKPTLNAHVRCVSRMA